jgi:hypothetical protein
MTMCAKSGTSGLGVGEGVRVAGTGVNVCVVVSVAVGEGVNVAVLVRPVGVIVGGDAGVAQAANKKANMRKGLTLSFIKFFIWLD